jgi:N-acetylglucosaminyldiphosphoundecaprenol N-acetyl-beta-D-mannosaminyltransferase
MKPSNERQKAEGTNTVSLLGVEISTFTLANLLQLIESSIEANKQLVVGNVNIYAMNLAYEDAEFRNILNQFDVVFCDGFGVKLGASLLGLTIPERYTPPDFLDRIIEILIRKERGLFLLGAKPGITEKAKDNLHNAFPNLKVSGIQHGYFNKAPGSQENADVLNNINASHPAVVLVAFGMPLQEKWISENASKLDPCVILPVGALFDTLSGEVHRGPKFLTDHGFEWLARLLIEPRRLWKRYLIGNPLFFLRVIKHRLGFIKPKSR